MPDFLDSLLAFQPQQHRVDGLQHLVVFPMYTQNGSPDRLVEAVLIEVIWPEFIAELEAGEYDNPLFVPIRFVDFTPGYDTNSAVLFPETVAVRETPTVHLGRDLRRPRGRPLPPGRCAPPPTSRRCELPDDAAGLLDDQELAEETFVMWDIIHDRTHMRGDLPFDPFMIKQRMPFFLYSLEELRCDLTAFRESVKLEGRGRRPGGTPARQLVQYAVIFDRIFRFAITGDRVRNYDGLGGQLLFAWLHQHDVLHWTDSKLSIDWDEAADVVVELGDADRGAVLALDRPPEDGPLARRLRAGLRRPSPRTRPRSGPRVRTRCRSAGPPRGLTDAGARRRVSAVDVLRGAREEDAPRDRVHRRHHGHVGYGRGGHRHALP